MSSRSALLFCALLTVSLLYVAQLWTPLRLNGDSVVLLSIASSAADGHGYLDHGTKTHYPPGYPAMVVGLERIGAAHSWGLVGLNAFFMVLGFASAYRVARCYFRLSRNWAAFALLFASLSFALIKHFTLPLTDIPFLGFSLLAVALIVTAEQQPQRYYAFWLAALLVALASIVIRPVGIALLPCLAWSLGVRFGLLRVALSRKALLIVSCLVIGIVASIFLLHTKYVQEALAGVAQQGVGHVFSRLISFRVREAGELALNAPASKLGRLAPLVWVIGLTAILWLAFTLRRARIGSVEIYLAAYACIFLLWPYGDTRFWNPVLPLLSAELLASLAPWTFTGWKKLAGLAYSSAYLLMGLLAMAYSTWITFSGAGFARRYGDDHLRPTYAYFYSASRDQATVNQPALELLKRYSR